MRNSMFSAVKSFVAANWRSGNGFVAIALSRADMVISYISLSWYCDFSVLNEGFWWIVVVEWVWVCVDLDPKVVESAVH